MQGVKKQLLLGAIAASIFGVMVAGQEPMDGSREIASTAGEKKPFSMKRGDGVLTVGGKSVTEHRFSKNAVMLNNKIPDELNHFRETLDLGFNYAYGEEKFKHKALEVDGTIRFKTIWGKIGETVGTEKNNKFKVLGASVGEHTHASMRSLLWVKNAWLKASWNAIFNVESDNIHTFKLGMFPFELGRGIALGSFYGSTRDFLALYNKDSDFSAPGILFSGEAVKDILWYDLYYSKLESKTASFGDVFNSNKERIFGRRTTPWVGSSKDNDLFAARLKVKPLKKTSGYGDLEIEPYVFFNEASDQKVEVVGDSKSMLGALGCAAEYGYKNFEFGGEFAMNYGEEVIRSIDRNEVVLLSESYEANTVESVHEVYSKVTYKDASKPVMDGKKVVVDPNSKSAITRNRSEQEGPRYNNAIWTPTPADINAVAQYQNAKDRYRCPYKNQYRGWMGVLDTSYLFEDIDLKIAAAWGYASGDCNPHAVEKDKSYKGFVGLYEGYVGKRVPSVLMLDARKIKRPLTLVEGTNEVDSDASFTDLHFVGIGTTWAPKSMKAHPVSLNPNLLFFWKAHESNKYDACLNDGQGGIVPCSEARTFMGTELNLLASIELLKDLTLFGSFAYFVPSSYYKDIKGAPMRGDLFNKLEEEDREDLDSARYRIGDSNAFYSQISLEYRF